MNYLGDFAEDETIYTWFTTNDADGGRVAFSAALETADFEVIKDGNATGTTAGITTDEDFDSKTGIHKVTVATTDAFYVTGSDYALLMYPDETVDSQSVAHVVATWSIENRYQMQTGDSFARIGAAGAGLTDLGGMSTTMKGQVNTEADTALSDYDAPTKTEMDSAFTEIKGTSWASGTDTLEHIRNKQTDIETDTNEVQTKVAAAIDANGRVDIGSINGATVTGDGDTTPWGAA